MAVPLTVEEAQAELGPLNAPIVSTVDAPGGGTWALGADGGVFSLGGAPFFGSYVGLDPKDRLGERSFERIERTGQGGYRLISNRPGEVYNFQPPAGTVTQTQPVAKDPAAPPPVDTKTEGAKASVQSTLKEFGLTFSPTALDNLFNIAITRGGEGFMLELRQTPEYAQRFPGMQALREAGRAIDESTYIGYERTIRGELQKAGLPAGFYDDPTDFASMIEGELSPREISDRIQSAGEAARNADPEALGTLQRVYGVTPGELTALFLDPDRGEAAIQRRISTGQLGQVGAIGGAATRTGFGGKGLSQSELERLANLGITAEQAQQGFGQLIQGRELFQTLPGEAGADITQTQQLAATFEGDEEERERIRKRAAQRVAQFGGGGQFAAGQEGVSGLGG